MVDGGLEATLLTDARVTGAFPPPPTSDASDREPGLSDVM
jgi:hypothetical protein